MNGNLSRLLAAALMVVLTLAAAPAPATSSAAPAASSATGYAGAVLRGTNAERAQHDLVPLRRSTCLQRFADRQARRMAKQRRLFHQPLGRIQRRCRLGEVGENVAYGFPGGRAVVRAWMRSPGHRANILNRRLRLTAVGARRAGGHWWVAQVYGARN